MFRLTSCLVAVVLLAGVGNVDAALTHYYPFDMNMADVVGGNNGTPVGGAHIVTDAERGNVLDLDGIDDYVALQYSNIPGGPTDTSVFTIAAWVKRPEGEIIPEKAGGIYGEYWNKDNWSKNRFFNQTDGRVAFGQYPPSGGGISSTSSITDDTWHHIAYVQGEPGSFRQKIYVDGVLETWDDAPEEYSGPNVNLWVIGARLGKSSTTLMPRFTEGRIDELRFYNHALTAEQIRAIPEPSTLVLLLTGAVVLFAWYRRS